MDITMNPINMEKYFRNFKTCVYEFNIIYTLKLKFN